VSAEARAYYIAGRIDGFITIDTGDNAKSECTIPDALSDQEWKAISLRMGYCGFAQARPDLHAKPVLADLLQYLTAVCGDPPR
jgi:hypothetical protein